MTLSYVGSNSTSGSNTLRAVCIWEAGNYALITDSDAARLRWYDLTTQTMTASTTVTNFPGPVALINSASAVVASYSSSTVDFIELASNTRSAVSGSITSTNSRPNLMAADTANSIAMYVGNGTSVGRVRGATFTVDSVPVRTSSNNRGFTCIVYKSAGRFIVGTANGSLYEIDTNGNIMGEMDIVLASSPGTQYGVDGTIGAFTCDLTGIWYDNNIVTVSSTMGNIFVVDWTTKELINSFQYNSNGTGTPLANTGSGEAIYCVQSASMTETLTQLDLTNRCPNLTGMLYGANAANNTIGNIGINTQTGRGVYFYLFGPVRFFDVTSQRATTTRTFTVSPGGVHQKCQLTLIEEVSGVATGRPILDTIMQSPATYRVPTGKAVIELIKTGEGITSSWQVNRYTT